MAWCVEMPGYRLAVVIRNGPQMLSKAICKSPAGLSHVDLVTLSANDGIYHALGGASDVIKDTMGARGSAQHAHIRNECARIAPTPTTSECARTLGIDRQAG